MRITAELKERGISADLMGAALLEYDHDWQHRLKALHEKKFGYIPDNYAEQAKQSRFLQYRGFYPEHIRALLS